MTSGPQQEGGVRIAVTGDGAVSCLGPSVSENLAGLYAGVVQPLTFARVEATLRQRPPVFEVPDLLGGVRVAAGFELTRTSKLALLAAREAWARAGLADAARRRIGVCLGTTVGCTFDDEAAYRGFRQGDAVSAATLLRYLRNDLSRVVADDIGATGPTLTVSNACASGADAIGVGAAWLAADECDVVLAGGADALTRFPYLGFNILGNSDTRRCRPFDRQRAGLNLGEGAGVVVLERAEDALRRGVAPIGFVAGYGSATDAFHATAPHPDGRGLRQAIATALVRAGCKAADIGFVNPHGTGTTENDRVEGRVLADLFTAEAVVCATKGYTGHTLGAAGALEAIFTLRNLRDDRVPASGGFADADPECGIVPTRATSPVHARWALSTSLAFGGANVALVLERGAP